MNVHSILSHFLYAIMCSTNDDNDEVNVFV